jgi:hypothetical protein
MRKQGCFFLIFYGNLYVIYKLKYVFGGGVEMSKFSKVSYKTYNFDRYEDDPWVQLYAPHIDQRAKKFRNENSLKGIYGPVYESSNNNFPASSRERKVFYRPRPVLGSQTMKRLSKKNEMNSTLKNRNFKPHYSHQREIDKVNDWLFGLGSWMNQVNRLDTKRIGPDNELNIRYDREKRAWDKRPSLLGWVFESNPTLINDKRATVHESQRSSKAIPTPLRSSQAMKRMSKKLF